MPKKTIIIGLDGVPFGLLKKLAETGIMPNTGKLIANGTFKKMSSSIPEISSVAWSSIITGTNPGEHGIFGFTDFSPGTYQLSFPNFNNLKKSPFWTKIAGKSVIINVPATYPVKEMDGIHISGFVSIHLEKSVYPQSLLPELKELDYRIDVDSAKAHQSLELFLSDLEQTLKARIRTYRYLWEKEWETFMLVFTGTDRLMHFLWNAYEDKEHQYHQDFLNHFHQIDEVIGEIKNKISNEDSLIILSDHGFEGLDKEVYINYLLKKEGFLKLQDTDEPTGTDIDYFAKAFALDPARIYLNLKDKYPHGSVEPKDKGKILEDLDSLFNSLKIENKKVIRDIYRKEEIYSGPLLDQAPDLILVGNKGFNLKGTMKADKLSDKGIFTGKHSQDDAFLLTTNKINIPENPVVSDVVGLIKGGK